LKADLLAAEERIVKGTSGWNIHEVTAFKARSTTAPSAYASPANKAVLTLIAVVAEHGPAAAARKHFAVACLSSAILIPREPWLRFGISRSTPRSRRIGYK